MDHNDSRHTNPSTRSVDASIASTTGTSSAGSAIPIPNDQIRRDATVVALQTLTTQIINLGHFATAEADSESERLFPEGSLIEQFASLVQVNTDLPPETGPHLASTIIGHSLTKLGLHVALASHHVVRPNLSMALVFPSEVDLRFILGSILTPVLSPCACARIPFVPTAKSLLRFVTSAEALSEITVNSSSSVPARQQVACGMLLSAEPDQLLANSRASEGAALSTSLIRAMDGNRLEGDVGKGKYVRSMPVHLSLCLMLSAARFFARVSLAALLDGVPSRLLLVRVGARAGSPRLSYGTEGVGDLARSFAEAWTRVESGPRAYGLTSESRELLHQWWTERCPEHGVLERQLRRCVDWALSYSLIIAAIERADGEIDARTMRAGLDIVDQHLRNLSALMGCTGASDLHRYVLNVESYLRKCPDASRGELLKLYKTFSAKDLNTALEVLAELHPNSLLGDSVMNLLGQSRTARS